MPNPWESAPLDHKIGAVMNTPAPWESAPPAHQELASNSDWGEGDASSAWSDTPPIKHKKAVFIPTGKQDDGFEPSNEEALAKYGIGVKGGPSLPPSAVQGAGWLARHAGPGTILGDMSNTRMGRELTGLTDLPMGVAQGLSHLTGNGQEADAYTKLREGLIQANRTPETQSQDVMGGDPLRFIGGMLTPLPGSGSAKGIAGAAKAAGVGGILGALQPNPNVHYDDQGGNDYLSSTTGQGVKGAALNTLLHGGTRYIGNKIAGKTTVEAPTNVNGLGEDIANNLSENTTRDMGELASIASSGTVRANKAQKILDEVSQTGIDPTHQIQLSAKVRQLMEQGNNDALFATRDQLLQGVKSTAPKTVAELDAQIAVLNANPHPDAAAVAKKLSMFRDNLLGDTSPKYSLVLDPNGNPVPVPSSPISHRIEDLSRARSSVKEDVRGFYTGQNATTGALGAPEAQRLADSLSGDISDAARLKGGDALAADEAANKAYAEFKSKWGAPANRSLMTSLTPDELLNPIMAHGADRANNAINALTPMGHDAVKSMVYSKLIDETGGDPSKFLAVLKPMRKSVPSFFTGEEGARMDGLTKIMETAQNIGNASGPVAGTMAGATGGVPGMAMGALGGSVLGRLHFGDSGSTSQMVAKAAKWLLSTDRGQQWLLKVSKQNPDPATLSNWLSQIESESALASGQAQRPEVQPPNILNQLRGQ